MSTASDKKLAGRILRKARVRAKVHGTATSPRISVFISNQHVSAQAIDDESKRTLASATSMGKAGTMTEKCVVVGTDIAKKIKKAGVTHAVFDRNGRQYGGRLKAFAEAARKEGLEF